MKTIIRTEGLCRGFKVGSETVHALKDVYLDIQEGTLTLLKGRSGSGKTTLINLLGAIDSPSSGTINFENNIISSMDEEAKNIIRQTKFGFIFQTGALIPNMTVFENVEFVLRLAKFPIKERRRRVEECISHVGLSKKINQYPEELSGGEIQRIGIARAIANRPKVIFADEPTSALDFTTGLKVIKLLKDLIAREGITIVMATHDQKLMHVADCVYSLKDGEIINE